MGKPFVFVCMSVIFCVRICCIQCAVFLLYTHFLDAVVYMEREKCVCMCVCVCVCVMDLYSSRDWSVADPSERNNDPSSPIKDTEFIDWLQDF
jgi:hypothetical protein